RNGSANEFEPETTNQSFDRHLPSSSTQSYEKEVPLRTTSTVMKRPIRVTWRSARQSVIGRNIIPTWSARRLDPFKRSSLPNSLSQTHPQANQSRRAPDRKSTRLNSSHQI